jgi:hypothetical protein
MLDDLVGYATDKKVVVALDIANGTGTQNLCLVKALASRYRANPRVWLNPDNEVNSKFVRTCECAAGPQGTLACSALAACSCGSPDAGAHFYADGETDVVDAGPVLEAWASLATSRP